MPFTPSETSAEIERLIKKLERDKEILAGQEGDAAAERRRSRNIGLRKRPPTEAASTKRDTDPALFAPHGAAGQMQSIARHNQYESLRDFALVGYL